MKYERTKKEAKNRKKFEYEKRKKREEYERYEREEYEKREREKREEDEKYIRAAREYRTKKLREQFLYLNKMYGANDINKKLARKNKDELELYKARKYVANENANGHECYNGIEGKKLWINREMWKNMHDRK